MTAALTATAAHPSPETPAVIQAPVDVRAFLQEAALLSPAEIQRAEQGGIVAKGLPVDDDEVAIVAAALIAVPPGFFIDQVRRIEEFKRSPEVQQIGRFGAVPAADDLAGLTMEDAELKAARRCRIGDCELKLDAAGIDRLRALPAGGDVMAALRLHLAEYAAAYLRQGNAALVQYRDQPQPESLSEHLKRIVAESAYLPGLWPDLHAAVAAFSGRLPGTLDGFLYWSKEKVGPRAVVSLTHVIIQPPVGGVGAVATKQIYASHYSTASVGLTVLADRTTEKGPRTLVIYLNRTRVDIFEGLLGGLKRPVVRSRARSGAERMMAAMRTKLEAEYKKRGLSSK